MKDSGRCVERMVDGRTFLALAVLIAASTWGRVAVPAELPPAVHADTETATNVPFAVALDAAGRLSFDLVCRATPSNNVEVAFGRDSDGNGMLDVGEEDCTVGWDCGAWFVREGADGEPLAAVPEQSPTGDVRTLSWRLWVGADGTPSRLDARADGDAVFGALADAPPAWLHSPSWNLLRLTGRGIDAPLGSFSVAVTPDGTTFFVR